jgi:L-lactate dehydrogenase complex protein LldG
MERSRFLARVRSRLASAARHSAEVPEGWEVEIDDLVGRFATELAAVGGKVQRTTPEEARWVLAEWPGATVLVSPEPGVPEGLDEVVQRSGGRVLRWPQPLADVANSADVGVTSALWGVAETGTLLVSSAPPGGRAPSLVPPTHVCFLPTDRIVATTADLFRRIGEMPERPSGLVLVTGPSKSADIGMELIVGVHGPGELHAVLIE